MLKNTAVSLVACSAGLFLADVAVAAPHRPEDVTAKHPHHVRSSIKPFLASSPWGLNPAQVRHAYGFDQIAGDGSGQTIGIVVAYGSPTLQSDLANFSSTYGLPAASLKVYYPQGTPAADSGWALETSLDVEWAHAMAPGASIVVVVAKTANLSNLLSAVDYAVSLGAKQIGMSWGGSEFSSETSYDSHFNKTGVTFVAASGDNGAGVMWPAASQYVVGVGGTTLQLDGGANIWSEVAWAGSGGGISAYEPKPSGQVAWNAAAKRAVPDVAFDADPNSGFSVYISNYNGSTGWVTVGGTSAGAPQWAALFALVNGGRSTPLTGAVNTLYRAGLTSYYSYYRDVTDGNNGGYSALPCYDPVTGLGSPLVPNLVSWLRAN